MTQTDPATVCRIPTLPPRGREMENHTDIPWGLATFIKPDGGKIETLEDVAKTMAFSATQEGMVPELWGIIIPDTDIVIAYTGNGPTREQNARFIVKAVNMHKKLLGALEFIVGFDDVDDLIVDIAAKVIDEAKSQ